MSEERFKAIEARLSALERDHAHENKSEGAPIREDGGRAETDTTPRTATPSDPPTAWTEEQRWAMRDVIRSVTSNRPIGFDPDRVCAEIAKHAHLFVKRTISAEEFRVFCHAYTMDESEEIEDSMRAALSAIEIEVKT